MPVHHNATGGETNWSALDRHVLVDGLVANLARQANGDLAVLKHSRTIEPLAFFIAYLEQITTWTEHRVFSKLIAYFCRRKSSDLKLHEFFNTVNAVF